MRLRKDARARGWGPAECRADFNTGVLDPFGTLRSRDCGPAPCVRGGVGWEFSRSHVTRLWGILFKKLELGQIGMLTRPTSFLSPHQQPTTSRESRPWFLLGHGLETALRLPFPCLLCRRHHFLLAKRRLLLAFQLSWTSTKGFFGRAWRRWSGGVPVSALATNRGIGCLGGYVVCKSRPAGKAPSEQRP